MDLEDKPFQFRMTLFQAYDHLVPGLLSETNVTHVINSNACMNAMMHNKTQKRKNYPYF